ncbi:Rapgap1 [Trypoxylus dichotomus]
MVLPRRRQHPNNTTWHATPVAGVQRQTSAASPDRLKGTKHDLFDLLEKAQSSRLDDQRCVLPAYFKQVFISARHKLLHLTVRHHLQTFHPTNEPSAAQTNTKQNEPGLDYEADGE